MNKKVLLLLGLIIMGVCLYFILNNKTSIKENSDVLYTEITSDKLQTSLEIEVPKNSGIIKNVVGGALNEVNFISEEKGYRIVIFLYDKPYNEYEIEKNSFKTYDSFKEITINNFKGYEYNTNVQKIITLSLGQMPSGHHGVYSIYINRRKDYDKPLDELMDINEVKTIVNSVKIVEYVKK